MYEIQVPKPKPGRPGWPTPSDDEVVQYVLDFWSRETDVAFDPMCGLGTFVTKAVDLGLEAYGSDVRLPRGLPFDRFRERSAFRLRVGDWPPMRPSLIFTSPPLLLVSDRRPYPPAPGQIGNFTVSQANRWIRTVTDLLWRLATLSRPNARIAVTWRDDTDTNGFMVPIVAQTRVRAMAAGLRIREERPIIFGYEREPEVLTVFEVPR